MTDKCMYPNDACYNCWDKEKCPIYLKNKKREEDELNIVRDGI